MKFEKLNVDTNKRGIWILYGLVLGVVLIIIINYFISMAKYKVVDTTKLVSSNINYKLPDLTVLGIYIKEGEEYKYVDKIPEGNYTVNKSLSSCTKKGGEEIKDIIEYREDGLYIGIDERGTRCKVYLDGKATAKDTLAKLTGLSVNTVEQGCPTTNSEGYAIDITTIEGSKNLLCEGEDDFGKTYYFRGNVTNNWVKIGKTYWRIVRINGNGTIRLIYNATTTATQSQYTMAFNGEFKQYNTNKKDNTYVGFMYGTESASSYEETHSNTNESYMLKQLKTWWTSSEFPNEYKDLVDGSTGFCNDRTPYQYEGISSSSIPDTTYGMAKSYTVYGPYYRLSQKGTIGQPTFKCPQQNDLFTIEGSEKGNKVLLIPVGLITADEVMFAGGLADSNYTNESYYLYNGKNYWTMSPHSLHYSNSAGTYTGVFVVEDSGYLYNFGVDSTITGVRPVINLKADTPFKEGGDGSSSNPFVVELN